MNDFPNGYTRAANKAKGIPFAFQVTAALAARTHHSHVLPVHS